MSRSPRWSRAALVAVTTIVFAACVVARRPRRRHRPRRPPRRAREHDPGPRHGGPGHQRAPPPRLPTRAGPIRRALMRRRRRARTRRVQEDHRRRQADGRVPALHARRRVPVPRSRSASFGIEDSDYLAAKHAADKSLPRRRPTAPGPTSSRSGARATGSSDGQPRLLGHQGPDPEPRAPLERRGRAAPARAPVGQRRRDRQPRHRRHRDHQGRHQPGVLRPRAGLNTFYLGFNDTVKPWTNEKIRQAIAMGIDRQRIVDNFYPAGSEVADALHARARSRSAAPATRPGTSTSRRPRRSSPRAWPRRASPRSTPSSSSAPRSVATCPIRRRSRPRSSSSSRPTSASTPSSTSRSPAPSSTPTRRARSTASSCSAGAPTTRMPTNFLDYHFGSGSGKKFGTPFDDIVAALQKGAHVRSPTPTARPPTPMPTT